MGTTGIVLIVVLCTAGVIFVIVVAVVIVNKKRRKEIHKNSVQQISSAKLVMNNPVYDSMYPPVQRINGFDEPETFA